MTPDAERLAEQLRRVLSRTPVGRNELRQPQSGLSLPQRWLLANLDGDASLQDLAALPGSPPATRLPRDAAKLVSLGLALDVGEPGETISSFAPSSFYGEVTLPLPIETVQPGASTIERALLRSDSAVSSVALARPVPVEPPAAPEAEALREPEPSAFAQVVETQWMPEAPGSADPQHPATVGRRGPMLVAGLLVVAAAAAAAWWLLRASPAGAASAPAGPTMAAAPPASAHGAGSAPAPVGTPTEAAVKAVPSSPAPESAVADTHPPAVAGGGGGAAAPGPAGAAGLRPAPASPGGVPGSVVGLPPGTAARTAAESRAALPAAAPPAVRVADPSGSMPPRGTSSGGGLYGAPVAGPVAAVPAPVTGVPAAVVVQPPAVAVPPPQAAPSTVTPPVPAAAAQPAPSLVVSTAPAALAAPVGPTLAPSPLSVVEPRFPRDGMGLGGRAVVLQARLTVAPSGAVTSVVFGPLDASARVFERPARAALLQWRFPEGSGERYFIQQVRFSED